MKYIGQPPKNLVGRRFGRLLVVGPVKHGTKSSPGPQWYCKCDCGIYLWVISRKMLSGQNKSCGCLRRDIAREKMKRINEGVRLNGSHLALPNGVSAKRQLIYGYRRGARKRNIEFTIKDEDFFTLVLLPCGYCGCPPSTTSGQKFSSTFTHNGLDRIDNEKGYILDNVVPCCPKCNMMKNSLSRNTFIEHIKNIHTHLSL